MKENTTTAISTMDPHILEMTGTTTIKMITIGTIISEMSVMKDVQRTHIANTASANVGMDISKNGEDVKVIGEMKVHTESNTGQTTLIHSSPAILPVTARTWT